MVDIYLATSPLRKLPPPLATSNSVNNCYKTTPPPQNNNNTHNEKIKAGEIVTKKGVLKYVKFSHFQFSIELVLVLLDQRNLRLFLTFYIGNNISEFAKLRSKVTFYVDQWIFNLWRATASWMAWGLPCVYRETILSFLAKERGQQIELSRKACFFWNHVICSRCTRRYPKF